MSRREQEGICYAITGAFEGRGFGQLTGNFDAQGWSLGFLQWPLGQGTAQRLIQRIQSIDPKGFEAILGEAKAAELLDVCRAQKATAVSWANIRSVGLSRRLVAPEWARPLEKVITSTAGIQAQREMAQPYMTDARNDAKFYGIETVRGLALCFDIAVQNGQGKAGKNGRPNVAKAFGDRGGHALPYERKLKALAESIAVTCNPRWSADVRGRKMLIVDGKGRFRGADVDLETRYGLSDAVLLA